MAMGRLGCAPVYEAALGAFQNANCLSQFTVQNVSFDI
jgi:hypothetical protein